MKILEFKQYIKELPSLLKNKNDKVLVLSDKTYILNGLYPSCNYDYCKKHNLEILETQHFGGTIVNGNNDVCIGLYNDCNDLDIQVGYVFMRKIISFLKSKGLDIVEDENDVIIDGYKTASWMSTDIDGCMYTAIHIPFNLDMDLIKNVCTKEMVKVPKGLDEFGIDRNEMIEYLKVELDNFKLNEEELEKILKGEYNG